MKLFISILFFILSFQSWSKADDISNFEIGGFTLNQSLLDNYKKDYLISNWESQKHTYDFYSQKYYKIAFFKTIETYGSSETYDPYDSIVLYTLKTDNLFKIKSITGFRENMDIKNCYREQESIAVEIFNLFPNTTKKTYGPTVKEIDPTGNSTEKGIYFKFKDGSAAGTACIDYGEELLKKYPYTNDHMQVYLDTKEYSEWLQNEAWK